MESEISTECAATSEHIKKKKKKKKKHRCKDKINNDEPLVDLRLQRKSADHTMVGGSLPDSETCKAVRSIDIATEYEQHEFAPQKISRKVIKKRKVDEISNLPSSIPSMQSDKPNLKFVHSLPFNCDDHRTGHETFNVEQVERVPAASNESVCRKLKEKKRKKSNAQNIAQGSNDKDLPSKEQLLKNVEDKSNHEDQGPFEQECRDNKDAVLCTNAALSGIQNVQPFCGQWEGTNMGSAERSQKFFRLMGGYKGKANLDAKNKFKQKFTSLALSKKEEDCLNKGLEQQYEEAWESSRQKRGQGLGFASVNPADSKTCKFPWE